MQTPHKTDSNPGPSVCEITPPMHHCDTLTFSPLYFPVTNTYILRENPEEKPPFPPCTEMCFSVTRLNDAPKCVNQQQVIELL